ncbi:MAG TPA: ATP-binding protein [Thermoleophilia bacterium]|nr:ATP-binding protein [Thermoleophilia bacterium]
MTSTTQVSPSQLGELLAKAIPAGLPVLVTGAPGIGKSNIVEQAAAAAGADVILSHPVVSDPTDAKGLPWAEKGAKEATFLPFGEMAQALKATKPTVWFLDDLGQASPAVQASFMQLLLARRVNGHKLPDCVTFVAATNRRADRAGVSGILEPVKSRFTCIVELTPSLDDWCQWALRNDIPVELIAFLRFRPDLLNAFKPSADIENSPSPRTWANAAKILGLELSPDLEYAALAGAVGDGAAAELMGFLRMYRELPNIDAILIDPDSEPIPSQPNALYAVVTGLGARVSEENGARVLRYAERLMEAGNGEFAAVLVRDTIRKVPAIKETREFVLFASGEFASLVTGGA